MIPAHIVTEIHDRADLLQVIQAHVPDLKRKGKEWVGTSPWNKTEKTPSFSVNPARGIWKCFSSGNGGNDAPGFLMKLLGISYPEALRQLAQDLGIEVESDPAAAAAAGRVEAMRIATDVAIRFFVGQYARSQSAAQLAARGIDDETAEAWEIGHSGEEWDRLLRSLPADQQEAAIAAGLLKRSEAGRVYDTFRRRIIFPIRDYMGRAVGLAGRRWLDDPQAAKYINSADSDLYHKGEVLYGLHRALPALRDGDPAYLVEGYTDVIALHRIGRTSAVATCGTALTEAHVRLLGRFAQRVVVLRDADQAGQEAARRDVELLLKSGIPVTVVTLPEGEDPDSLLRGEAGAATMDEHLAGAVDGIDYLLSRMGEGSSPSDMGRKLREIGQVVQAMPWEVERELYIRHIAARLSQPEHLVGRAAGMEIAPVVAGGRQPGWLDTWAGYQEACEELGLALSPDTSEAPDCSVLIRYRSISGNPLTISQGKNRVVVTRRTSQAGSLRACYVPDSIVEAHTKYKDADWACGPMLVVCEGEMLADWLCQIGLDAVGFADIRHAVTIKSGGATLTSTLKTVVEIGRPSRLVLVLPDWALEAPAMLADETTEDAARLGHEAAGFLRDWERATRDYQTWVWRRPVPDPWARLWPGSWLHKLLATWQKGPHGNPAAAMLETIRGGECPGLYAEEITAGTPAQFEKLLHLDSPVRFYALHGGQVLGRRFRMGAAVYQIDRGGAPVLVDDEQEQPEVFESGGRLKARTLKGGIIRLGNWTLKCELEVKEPEESFGIYLVRNVLGQECRTLISESEFHSRAAFVKRLRNLPGKFFVEKLADSHLPIIQEMTNLQAPLATTIGRDLGFYEPTPDADGQAPDTFYAWGNGISTLRGEFIPADPHGVLSYGGRSYFMPAASGFLRARGDHAKTYRDARQFWHGSGTTSFRQYFDQYLAVNGPHGHIPFFFYLASLYVDLFTKEFHRFPLLFIEGRRGAGKGVLIETLELLFGKLTWLNLEANNTLASIAAHPHLVKNALAILDEFNISTILSKQGLSPLLEMTKNWYGRTGRRRMAGPHTAQVDESNVEGVVVLMGQEPIYRRDELDMRCVIVELPDREDTARSGEESSRYYDLMEMGTGGALTHITTAFFAERERIARDLVPTVKRIEGQLKSLPLIRNAAPRFHQNWAMLLAPLVILIRAGRIDYPLDEIQLLEMAGDNIARHLAQGQAGGKAGIFWEWVVQAHHRREIDDRIVFLAQGHDLDGKPCSVLRVQYGKAYTLFEDWLRKTRRNTELQNFSAKDMKIYLTGHPGFLRESRKNMQIGWARTATGSIPENPAPRYTSGLEFRYEALGIDLDQPGWDLAPSVAPAAAQEMPF